MGGKDSKETRAEANFVNVNYFQFFCNHFLSLSSFVVFGDKVETKGDRFSEIAMSPVPALPM